MTVSEAAARSNATGFHHPHRVRLLVALPPAYYDASRVAAVDAAAVVADHQVHDVARQMVEADVNPVAAGLASVAVAFVAAWRTFGVAVEVLGLQLAAKDVADEGYVQVAAAERLRPT